VSVPNVAVVEATGCTGLVTSKKRTFDTPPPGEELVTVTDTVLAIAMSEAGIVAVN
jgi:hypothetical protein